MLAVHASKLVPDHRELQVEVMVCFSHSRVEALIFDSDPCPLKFKFEFLLLRDFGDGLFERLEAVELGVEVLSLLLGPEEFVGRVLFDLFHLESVDQVVGLVRVPARRREVQLRLGRVRRLRQRRDHALRRLLCQLAHKVHRGPPLRNWVRCPISQSLRRCLNVSDCQKGACFKGTLLSDRFKSCLQLRILFFHGGNLVEDILEGEDGRSREKSLLDE